MVVIHSVFFTWVRGSPPQASLQGFQKPFRGDYVEKFFVEKSECFVMLLVRVVISFVREQNRSVIIPPQAKKNLRSPKPSPSRKNANHTGYLFFFFQTV